MYKLIEHTRCGNGYLSLVLDGRQVCDFFPFARNGEDEQFVREQAAFIVDALNAAIAVPATDVPDEGTKPKTEENNGRD